MNLKAKQFKRHKSGVMNETEKAYSIKLEMQLQLGLIKNYQFEQVKLKLGKNCYFTPDFMIVNINDEVEFHECKGFWMDDARVKIKVAADKFPFIFRAFTYKKKQFIEEDFTVR